MRGWDAWEGRKREPPLLPADAQGGTGCGAGLPRRSPTAP